MSAGIARMDALSLKYWLCKFVMELSKKSGERYPWKNVFLELFIPSSGKYAVN